MKDKWESIDKGASHPAKEMIKKAAQNILLLKQMVKDYKEEERRDFYKQILKQDKISSKVLAFLAKDGDNFTRNLVAQNPNTPQEALALLAKDEDDRVRKFVAQNPNTPKDQLQESKRYKIKILK